MALIQWNDELRLGIAQIDREHEALVLLVNELGDAMLLGKGRDIVADTLRKLADYADYHFRSEETLFDEHGFEGSVSHKSEHQRFVNKLNTFNATFAAGKTTLISVDVLSFLSDWVRDHIMISDRKYADDLRGRGVR